MTTISTQAELDAAAPAILSSPCERCKDVEHNYPPEAQAAVFAACPDCGGTGVPRVRELRLTPTEPLRIEFWDRANPKSEGQWMASVEGVRVTGMIAVQDVARVTVSGQVGPDARPLHPDWVRAIRDQCEAAEVEFIFEGWGRFTPEDPDCWPDGFADREHEYCLRPRAGFYDVGPEASGRVLDGRTYP